MEINNKKNQLSQIRVCFVMLLFAMCLTMHVFFSITYNSYESLDKTTVIETRTISDRIVAAGNGDNITCFKYSFLSENNSYSETITRNVCPIPMIAAIPKGFSPLLFIANVMMVISHFLESNNGFFFVYKKMAREKQSRD